MPKALTDTQRVILAQAAARDDRRVLPTPTSLNKNAGAIALSLRATLASGLVDEVPAVPGDIAWRSADDGSPTTLLINALGLTSIGVSEVEPSQKASIPAPPSASLMPRSGSKLDLLISRLSDCEGSTIEELMAVTGWQKHSVRGAISGALKTKRKLDVTSTVVEGRGRLYRIAASAAPEVTPSADVQP